MCHFTGRFQEVHVDLVEQLPPSKEFPYILFPCMDVLTRWAEAIPLQDVRAETVTFGIFNS